MSNDLRERVARAIFDASTFYGEWNRQPEATREVCFAMADAALAEMGEPAPASVREAVRVLCGSAETPFLEPASAITKELRNCGYLVPVRIIHKALRAIAEGKE